MSSRRNTLLRTCVVFLIFSFSLLGVSISLAAGLLDPNFGTNGVTRTSFGGSSGGTSAVRQPDGKIVIAGYAVIESKSYFALARYTVSGTLDTDFGVQGVVTTSVSASGQGPGGALAIQSDGQLVVVGSSIEGPMNSFLALARYSTTGALDPEFGAGGIVTTPLGPTGGANAVALQPDDGKIVVAGGSGMGNNIVVARYAITGGLDLSFGNSGMVTLSPGYFASASAVVIQPDHNIVVAGVSSGAVIVIRIKPDGQLDTAFGVNGFVRTSVPGSGYAGAAAVTLQSDGKILVTGAEYNISNSKNTLLAARYDITGTLDSSFGSGGIVTTTIGLGSDSGSSIVVQPDGRIVIGGTSNNGVRDNFAVVRYFSSGVLDGSWGNGGVVTTSIGTSSSAGNSLLLQPDGKIVLAGQSSDDGMNMNFTVARYLSDVYTHFVYLPLVRK